MLNQHFETVECLLFARIRLKLISSFVCQWFKIQVKQISNSNFNVDLNQIKNNVEINLQKQKQLKKLFKKFIFLTYLVSRTVREQVLT